MSDLDTTMLDSPLTSVEMCAGAGGQALGIEQAGFDHLGVVDNDPHCCRTLALNRPRWQVHHTDIACFDGRPYRGVDVLAGGLPCPPFSIAGKQLGSADERNLFPDAMRLVDEIRPRAVMIENVRGLLDASFGEYRQEIANHLHRLGYTSAWNLLNASDFGVPQLRPRVILIAVQSGISEHFSWPQATNSPPSVGATLHDLMAAEGWPGAYDWHLQANTIAPTIVGGSKKHGGPDLGPTRARRAWATLGVDGRGIWDQAPSIDFQGMPRLTVRMVARLQGFPDSWQFSGRKTAAYRQVGNAFPPPVARAVAMQLRHALSQRHLFAAAAAG